MGLSVLVAASLSSSPLVLQPRAASRSSQKHGSTGGSARAEGPHVVLQVHGHRRASHILACRHFLIKLFAGIGRKAL